MVRVNSGWVIKSSRPLTIADSYSHFIFIAKGMYGEKFKPAQLEFRRVFREFGTPDQIHTDNGTPFGAPLNG